ncbi:hypothetical protein NliqN6_4727 [Naganishia liquefaciens]|uniref:RecF/RecN/SMC N-terminal domain-containing protein n=1 Tax=Naganishia liquefaciens TaxID=104408 RepID=A0A8H3TW54_9TREE|nr:hypothetical protein NliqN6_4727 [Naganishia liquefaciens]
MAKRRIDEDEDEEEESELYDDEEDEPTQRKRAKTGAPPGYEDLVAMDAEQEAETAKLAKRMKTGAAGATQGGLIRSVYLENFLCHSRLSFTFGPQMNFIIGHNGSGKSAVLTALVVVLGGKSASTGRANGVKDFVKSGTDRALVRVTLRNDGVDPFKYEEYGDSIDIERSITKEGQTQYKIKGRLGQKAVTARQARVTLGQLLDHFDIQVDNPMTVLNQDQSRHFLANADEGKKYGLFMEGTQLKQLKTAYDEMERLLKQMHENINTVDSNLPALRDESIKWSKELKSMSNATAMKDRVLVIRKDLAWAYPIQKQGEIQVVEAEKAKLEEKLDATQKKLDTAENKVAEHRNVSSTEEEERTKILAEIEDFNQSIVELDQNFRDAQKKIRDTDNNLRDLKDKIRRNQDLISGMEKAHAEEQKRNGQDELQKRRQDAMDKKAEAQRMLDRIEREIPITEAALKNIYDERARLQQQIEEASNNRQAAQSHFQQLQSHLNALQQRQGSGDPLAAFGRNLRQVYAAIDRAQWAHSKPIGPLGMHVSIDPKDAPYQKILDTLLANSLASWAVRDSRDKRTLLNIFQQCIRNGTTFYNNGRETKSPPTIIEHAGELFDFANGDYRHMHPTVLSKLDIDDEQVIRLLVNSNNVESIFCARTRREADDVAKSFHRPGRTVQVWAADLFRVNSTRTGGLQSTVINPTTGMSVLSKDIASEINALQQNLVEADATFRNRSQEYDDKRQGLAALEARYRQTEAQLKKLKNGQTLAEKQISKFEQELEKAVPADMSMFEEDIAKEKAKLESLVEQMVGLEQELQTSKAALEPIRAQRETAKGEINVQRERLDRIEQRVAHAERIRKQAEADKLHWIKKHQQIQDKIQENDDRIAQLRTEFESWRQKAMHYTEGEEREPDKGPEALQTELKAAESALAKSSARHRFELEYVEDMVNASTAAYQEAEKSSEQLRVLYEDIHDSLRKRKSSWHRMRDEFAGTVKTNFHRHCQRRNFVGEIEFSHDTGKLKMKVQTEEIVNRDGNRAAMNKHNSKDPRALSGGETSFATICLLLSIWECVACPLRCLDEFDVFMDAHNRKLAMSLLMETAKYQTDRQYILITPQDMAGVSFGPSVKAHKMPDPERGVGRQARLDFPARP